MKKQKKCILNFAVVTALCVLGFMLAFSAQATTSSFDETDADIAKVYTDTILSKAEISVGANDKVVRTDGKGCISLTIVRAFPVEIDFHGQTFTVECAEGTVADAVKAAGITLTGAEEITPSLDTIITRGCKITVVSDYGVTVIADGETQNYNVTVGTVGDLLEDLGITLSEDDEVTPSLDEMIFDGMAVTVKRIEYKEETTTEVIDYGYVSEETSSLVSGTSKIKQYGIEGERTLISKNKYIDGELAESVVISDEVTREPVDQIKLIGTGKVQSQSRPSSSSSSSGNASVSNKAGTFVDASGKTVSYTKKLTGTSTAYYAAEGSMTATGTPVFVGGVAVNPNVIPYGTKLYIVTSDGSRVYGYATAVDTGGALMSGSVLVDVFFETYGDCVSWGRRNVTVYVLD